MTTKELLDEYRILPLYLEHTERRREEIIKEIEASIRKEVVEEILYKFYEGDWVSQANAFWTEENTTGYVRAKEEFEKFLKGITLK